MWSTPDKPYQELPPLPPAQEVETPTVLKSVIAASRALAHLEGACKRLPDPTMLINLIPLMEAQASSEIEHIVTTNDELFKAAHDVLGTVTPQTKEALNYRAALHTGFEQLQERPLTAQTSIEVCSTIRGFETQIRALPGTFIGNPRTHECIYTPPAGKEVISKHLRAWEDFLHGSHGIDPLVVMALAHYQFEAIHPFSDGNGRTGRILNLLILIESGLLEYPILYLSGHIMRHKDDYYARLNAVTRNDEWEPWILFMLEGVESTAKWTLDLVKAIDDLRQAMEDEIRKVDARLPAADLARLLFAQPYLRIENVVEAGLSQRQTASRWLAKLANAGLVQKQKFGRSVIYVNDSLLDVLFKMPLPA